MSFHMECRNWQFVQYLSQGIAAVNIASTTDITQQSGFEVVQYHKIHWYFSVFHDVCETLLSISVS